MAGRTVASSLILWISCLLVPGLAVGHGGSHVCVQTHFGPALSALHTTCRKAKQVEKGFAKRCDFGRISSCHYTILRFHCNPGSNVDEPVYCRHGRKWIVFHLAE